MFTDTTQLQKRIAELHLHPYGVAFFDLIYDEIEYNVIIQPEGHDGARYPSATSRKIDTTDRQDADVKDVLSKFTKTLENGFVVPIYTVDNAEGCSTSMLMKGANPENTPSEKLVSALKRHTEDFKHPIISCRFHIPNDPHQHYCHGIVLYGKDAMLYKLARS